MTAADLRIVLTDDDQQKHRRTLQANAERAARIDRLSVSRPVSALHLPARSFEATALERDLSHIRADATVADRLAALRGLLR